MRQSLIDHFRYGVPYYRGDVNRDVAETLENLVEPLEVEKFKDHVRSECLSQLPKEDFLCEIIDALGAITDGSVKKADMIDKIKHVMERLEDIQQCQLYASEHARAELRNL